ncbi:MAG: DUF1905 domain-containing protein [bacterium]
MKKISFQAVIQKEGINPYVDPPLGTGKALGRLKGVIPVKIWLADQPFQTNLMPLGAKRSKAAVGEHHRLYLHGLMRKAMGKDVGDRIKVVLALDTQDRTEPMNPVLAKAFKKFSKAKAVFEQLSPSHQKELNRYLNRLKSKEALERNLMKVMDYLTKPKVTWFGKKK